MPSSITASKRCVTNNCIRGDPKGFFLRINSFFQKVIGKSRAAFFLFGNIKIGDHTITRIKFILPLLLICKRAFTWSATKVSRCGYCSSAPSISYNGDTSLSWPSPISWTGAVSYLGLGTVSSLVLASANNLPPIFSLVFEYCLNLLQCQPPPNPAPLIRKVHAEFFCCWL